MHSSSPSPLVLLAACASAAAGLVHAAAAGSHAELRTLALLFAAAAVAQLGWAAVVAQRSNRSVLVVGAGIQVATLATWALSRTVGISFVEGLDSGRHLGLQDGTAVGLELIALAATIAAVARPTVRIAVPVVPVLASALLLAAVPAMATPHDHSGSDHGDHEVAAGEDVHVHEDDAAHDHTEDPATGPGAATSEDLGYPASFVSWLDTATTPAYRARAERLLIETNAAMQAFPDEAAVQAAGYISIGDGVTGWEHYINIGLIADPAYLDPNGIESIVLKVNPDGTKEVASAMYLLPFGFTMDDAPDIAGDLTPWHDHQNLCWEGARVVGTTDATGSCERGVFRGTQPMIHVWVTDNECGPFAGIEGSHGTGCAHHHDDEVAAG